MPSTAEILLSATDAEFDAAYIARSAAKAKRIVDAQSLEASERALRIRLESDLATAQKRIAQLEGGSVPPPANQKPPPATTGPIAPKAPTAPRNAKIVPRGIELPGPLGAVDAVFGKDVSGDAAVMIRGDNSIVERVTVNKPQKYALYVEAAENVTIRDVTIAGPSKYQSQTRTARATGGTKAPSVTFERVWISTPDGQGRANFRGEGERDFIDCRSEGHQWASGPLCNDDGGDNHGFTRDVANVWDNGAAIAKALNAANPQTPADALAIIRNAKPIVGGKPYTLTDDVWAKTLAYRAAELGGWSKDSWHACYAGYGIGLMAGAVVELDGTNEINVPGKVFIDYAGEYPRKGFAFAWDKRRAAGIFRGNGDKVTAPGGWGLSEAQKQATLRGTWIVNGVREVYAE